MNNIKAIIFDIDGVLIDHQSENGHNWTKKIENDLGIKREIVEEIHKDSKRWKELSLGKDKLESYLDEFVEKYRLSRVNAMQIVHYFIKNDANIRGYIMDEIKMLKQKNYKLYIGTHQEPYKGSHLWDIVGFKDYFEYMFTSYNTGYMKTDIEFFDVIREKLGFKAEELVLVDDKLDNVETAKRAGWQGYYYTTFEKAKEEFFNKL